MTAISNWNPPGKNASARGARSYLKRQKAEGRKQKPETRNQKPEAPLRRDAGIEEHSAFWFLVSGFWFLQRRCCRRRDRRHIRRRRFALRHRLHGRRRRWRQGGRPGRVCVVALLNSALLPVANEPPKKFRLVDTDQDVVHRFV